MRNQPTHRITHGPGHGRHVTHVASNPTTGKQLVLHPGGFMQQVDPSKLQPFTPTAPAVPETFPPGDVRTSKQPFVPAPYSLQNPDIINQPSALPEPEYAPFPNRAITDNYVDEDIDDLDPDD